jgi:predicted outer membrane lipoprotein
MGFGFVLVSTPETGGRSHLIGWTALAVGFTILIKTMDLWVRYAQVLLGSGIIGAIAIFTTGHAINSKNPVPRAVSGMLTIALVGCSLIMGTLAERRLQIFDRIGLVVFVGAFFGALAARTPAVMLVCLTAAFGILLALWLYNRYKGEKASANHGWRRNNAASDLHGAG